ncbi:hypothetical protein [Chlorobium sp.]|jgi:hypothetical protein|uniref:hypothetical protein n=1 Tax=Chlorobium sp. TaxID=1095 RepID=UPI002F40CE09
MENQDVSGKQDTRHTVAARFFRAAVPLLVLLLAGGMVLMYYMAEWRLREASENAGHEKQRYERLVDEQALDIQRSDVRLFAMPLAWAIRRELIQQNYGQVEEYFIELIRHKQFRSVMLLDPDGTVRIATDRKLQGSTFSSLYPGMDALSQQVVSYSISEGSSMFLVPVMGLNERIGTIAFVYSFSRLVRPQ